VLHRGHFTAHTRWRLRQSGPLNDHDDQADDSQQRAERKRLPHGKVLYLADRGCDGREDQADDNEGLQAHVQPFQSELRAVSEIAVLRAIRREGTGYNRVLGAQTPTAPFPGGNDALPYVGAPLANTDDDCRSDKRPDDKHANNKAGQGMSLSSTLEGREQFHVSILHVPFGPWQPTRADSQ
jgi:hypothetical protein